jgi:hypothetical protein
MLAMRGHFDPDRKAAGVAFQFGDITAKTASDTGGLGCLSRASGVASRRVFAAKIATTPVTAHGGGTR